MPIYEYECKHCHKTSELIQKMSDPTPSKCSHCGKTNSLFKLISRPAAHSGALKAHDPDRELPPSAFEDLTAPPPAHFIRDKDGHLVEGDPNDPDLHKKKDPEAS